MSTLMALAHYLIMHAAMKGVLGHRKEKSIFNVWKDKNSFRVEVKCKMTELK
jgi:hypothetical protein